MAMLLPALPNSSTSGATQFGGLQNMGLRRRMQLVCQSYQGICTGENVPGMRGASELENRCGNSPLFSIFQLFLIAHTQCIQDLLT